MTLFLFRLADPSAAQAELASCNSTADYKPTAMLSHGQQYWYIASSTGPEFLAIVGDVLIKVDSDTSSADASQKLFDQTVAAASS